MFFVLPGNRDHSAALRLMEKLYGSGQMVDISHDRRTYHAPIERQAERVSWPTAAGIIGALSIAGWTFIVILVLAIIRILG